MDIPHPPQAKDGPANPEEGPSMTTLTTAMFPAQRSSPPAHDAANAAADRYLSDRVMTASPAELTQMLYDAAVGAIRGAVRLGGAEQYAAATPRLVKAQDIVLELRSTLNHEAGPLATTLDSLYTWIWQRLVDANLRRNTAAAAEALASLEQLADAWRQSCVNSVAAG